MSNTTRFHSAKTLNHSSGHRRVAACTKFEDFKLGEFYVRGAAWISWMGVIGTAIFVCIGVESMGKQCEYSLDGKVDHF